MYPALFLEILAKSQSLATDSASSAAPVKSDTSGLDYRLGMIRDYHCEDLISSHPGKYLLMAHARNDIYAKCCPLQHPIGFHSLSFCIYVYYVDWKPRIHRSCIDLKTATTHGSSIKYSVILTR